MILKTTLAATMALTLAVPALAHEHKPTKPGMAGMDHGMMMNDPSNPYGKAEMDMHMKMMGAKLNLKKKSNLTMYVLIIPNLTSQF